MVRATGTSIDSKIYEDQKNSNEKYISLILILYLRLIVCDGLIVLSLLYFSFYTVMWCGGERGYNGMQRQMVRGEVR